MDSEVVTIRTGSRPVVRDITGEAAGFVAGRGDGLLHVFVPHATAGVALIGERGDVYSREMRLGAPQPEPAVWRDARRPDRSARHGRC